MSWNKWKVNNFPSPWQGLEGVMKQKVNRKVEKEREKDEEGPE